MADHISIVYEFTLPDGDQERFDLLIDAQTMELISPRPDEQPFWTQLEFEQCPHCPFTPDTHPHCPVALNLVPAIACFAHLMSYEAMTVNVINDNRSVIQKTSAQEGISSLMGLLIASSSCPITHFFKPMARFHLPFANRDETIWRAAATYLMARYFTEQGLSEADMTLSGLEEIYNDVARLNDAVIQRLRKATSRDSAVNALVHLDVFAKFFTPPLEDSLALLKATFEPFLVMLR